MGDMISRQQAINALIRKRQPVNNGDGTITITMLSDEVIRDVLNELPSVQPEPRYAEEELRVFQHGISLSLLSKRSAQHWRYDENTATEIKFLERLYEKVSANIRGGQNE